MLSEVSFEWLVNYEYTWFRREVYYTSVDESGSLSVLEGGLFGVMSGGSKMAAPDQKRVLVVDSWSSLLLADISFHEPQLAW